MIEHGKVQEIRNEIDFFLSELDKKENIDKPIYLYGNGIGLNWYLLFMKMHHKKVTGIINGIKKANEPTEINGIPIIFIENFQKTIEGNSAKIILISAPKYRKAINNKIKETLPQSKVYMFDPSLRIIQQKSTNEIRKFILKNINKYNHVFSLLADNKSKEIFENIIYGVISNNCDFYEICGEEFQYFPDVVRSKLNHSEVFVDCGAFDGDSIEEFLKVTNNKYNKILAFEPSKENADIIVEKFSNERIKVFQKGVDINSGEVTFKIDNTDDKVNSMNCIVDETVSCNTVKIKVDKLDNYCEENITFIKMDIEGAELNALKGSIQLIEKYKPKLAISIYHKLEDYYEIIEYLSQLNIEYKYYIRHTWDCSGADTILFAL